MKTPLHGADGVLQQNRRHWKKKEKEGEGEKKSAAIGPFCLSPRSNFLSFPLLPLRSRRRIKKIPAADDPRTHQRRFAVAFLAAEEKGGGNFE